MGTFIVIIIVFILFLFLKDVFKQKEEVSKAGGMRQKYSDLIEIILYANSSMEVIQETGSSLTIGATSVGGTTHLILTQTFGKVNVQWKLNSPMFGKHSLEWNFNENMDQGQMAEKITNDMCKYNSNFFGS